MLPGVFFEAGLIAVLFAALRRTAGEDSALAGRPSLLAEPGRLVCASIGGYLDALPALPALGALLAAAAAGPLRRERSLPPPPYQAAGRHHPASRTARRVEHRRPVARARRPKRTAYTVAGALAVSAVLLAPSLPQAPGRTWFVC